jgi:hypothetical protein
MCGETERRGFTRLARNRKKPRDNANHARTPWRMLRKICSWILMRILIASDETFVQVGIIGKGTGIKRERWCRAVLKMVLAHFRCRLDEFAMLGL